MIDEHQLLAEWADQSDKRKSNLAFNRLYAKYNKKVRRDVKNLGGEPDDDTQAVWLSLTKAMNEGRIPNYATLEEYLYRLTQMRVREARGESPMMQPLTEAATAHLLSPSAESVVSTGQLTDAVEHAIDRMPPDVQAAWRYKRMGHDEAYVCRQLKIPGRTYRRRIAQAREFLKTTLQETN